MSDPSAKLGERLLQGWTMLQEACPDCYVPLMRKPNSTYVECVGCVDKVKEPVKEEKPAPVEEPKVSNVPKLVPAQHYYDDLTSSESDQDYEEAQSTPRPRKERKEKKKSALDTEMEFLEPNPSDLEIFKERNKFITRFLASSYKKLDEITDNLEHKEANDKELKIIAANGRELLQAIAEAENIYFS